MIRKQFKNVSAHSCAGSKFQRTPWKHVRADTHDLFCECIHSPLNSFVALVNESIGDFCQYWLYMFFYIFLLSSYSTGAVG